jgi:membrane dipeptidase
LVKINIDRLKEAADMEDYKRFIIDGCTFTEGEFNGCAEDVLNSGLDAFFLTITSSGEGFKQTCRSIAKIYEVADKSDRLTVIKSYQDIINAKKNNKAGILLWFQDPHPIENKLDLLRVFYELGLRVSQLTYNKTNYIGTGCTESYDMGLTDFGKKLVKEMNRLGMIVDGSHSSTKTGMDAIYESEYPIIYSHANMKSVSQSPRNKTDEEVKLLAERGGVIGLTPWGPLCYKGIKDEQPTVEDYLDHVEYAANLVGIDHIAFGTDRTLDHSKDNAGTVVQSTLYPSVVAEYDKRVGVVPEVRACKGFCSIVELPNVIEGLKKRGFKDVDIDKFLGGNFLRVFKQVWK